MESLLAPIDLAVHWPLIDAQLSLERWPAAQRVLRLLATLLVESDGEPAQLGRQRLRGLGLTPGEAGNAWRALVELERRRVVERLRGSGRTADARTFRTPLRNWRCMPWRFGWRETERCILGEIDPRELALSRAMPWSERCAIPEFGQFQPVDNSRPGLLSVDSRGKAPARAAKRQRPGLLQPIAAEETFFFNNFNVKDTTLKINEVITALDPRHQGAFGAPLNRLEREAAHWSPDVVAYVCEHLAERGTRSPDRNVTNAIELASEARARATPAPPAGPGPSRFTVPAVAYGLGGGDV